MTRRLLLAALAALTVAATARPDVRINVTGADVNYRIYYLDKATNRYELFTYCLTQDEASKAATHLQRLGMALRVHITTDPLPTVAPPPVPAAAPSDVVTLAQATAAFHRMAAQSDISFRFPADGCYARAHLMVRRLQALGYRPRKAWTVMRGEMLYVRTSHHPAGYVEWGYHVAPTLRVRTATGEQDVVIDPSMFDRPVTVSQWANAQRKTANSPQPLVSVTRLGEGPTLLGGRKAPGSGFVPGNDPPYELTDLAQKIMQQFKPYEDRSPNPSVMNTVRKWLTGQKT